MTVRFMSIIRGPEITDPVPMALMEAIGKFMEEGTKAGVFAGFGGLTPSNDGARVRIKKGKIQITDGPFTESKEIVGGYAIFDVKDREEAVEWTKRFMDLHITHWPGWEGESELRQMYGPDEGPPVA